MQFTFDLISDLHLETWDDDFNWSNQATSPYCIVAGDICRDRSLLVRTLRHLGTCYKAVFYIDGNDEHYHYLDNIPQSYRDLKRRLKSIPNVVWMQDNVVVIKDTAILATNGWWCFGFGNSCDPVDAISWYQEKINCSASTLKQIATYASNDARYLANSVAKLQTHIDVKQIIIVTHTVPTPELITHDIELINTPRFNIMGNDAMMDVLKQDHANKIAAWCFGHYHLKIDTHINQLRYVNNCRGRGDTAYRQWAFMPYRIQLDL